MFRFMSMINTYAWSPVVAAATPFIYLGRQLEQGNEGIPQAGREGSKTERTAGEGQASDEQDHRMKWESPELAKLRDAVS